MHIAWKPCKMNSNDRREMEIEHLADRNTCGRVEKQMYRRESI